MSTPWDLIIKWDEPIPTFEDVERDTSAYVLVEVHAKDIEPMLERLRAVQALACEARGTAFACLFKDYVSMCNVLESIVSLDRLAFGFVMEEPNDRWTVEEFDSCFGSERTFVVLEDPKVKLLDFLTCGACGTHFGAKTLYDEESSASGGKPWSMCHCASPGWVVSSYPLTDKEETACQSAMVPVWSPGKLEEYPEWSSWRSDSFTATHDHISRVREILSKFQAELKDRGLAHDYSKLIEPERWYFDTYTHRLAAMEYGSEEYFASLKRLKPALDNHYAMNRHHPEHFENGITDMTLIDIVEMLADWKAGSERHGTGDIMRSIEINAERFNMQPQLRIILENTARSMFPEAS